MQVGIEELNIFGGSAQLDVSLIAEHRGLDTARFENLLMHKKAVALAYEDPVTFAVNAAKPIIDKLSEADKQSIEMVITCSESGLDFGKSLSTYVHHYLGLEKHCRLFEIKQACYSGTAGLQMAANFVLSQSSPGAKALVIATDISKFIIPKGREVSELEWAFAEPSGGAGAVAMLVSDSPKVFSIDVGASGFYSFEVMDTCRPDADVETGDPDLSLMSYLDCCKGAFDNYCQRVDNIDYGTSFHYLSFHTPFGGMVKGAHRTMMRKQLKASPAQAESDFSARVEPGLRYCQQVGNIMGATVLLSLASTIANAELSEPSRVGIFSYGSGCSSEFYSGIISPESQTALAHYQIGQQLDARYCLSFDEYEKLLQEENVIKFGAKTASPNLELLPELWASLSGHKQLYLSKIDNYHRTYNWS